MRSALAVIVFGLLLSVSAQAGDKIWSALVFASNQAAPEPTPAELSRYAGQLKNVFGYNNLKVIGSRTEALDGHDGWLIPSKRFYLRVHATEAREGGHLLSLELYQDKNLLLETRARLGRKSPLFIRGPLCGEGQLIIVLAVK